MILEVGICAFLAGSLFLALVRGLPAFRQRRARPAGNQHTRLTDERRLQHHNYLRRQKAFSVQEAEVWITCVQKLQALGTPKHTSTRR
jgi:hypothetical protein